MLLVGYSRAAESYISRVVSNPEWGYRVYGILDDEVPVGTKYYENQVIGKLSELDAMIKANTAAVKVLKSEDHWFGVTYHEDKQSVKDAFADLIARGVYDSPLDLVQR